MPRWLCSLLTAGRHRPEVMHPTCGRCPAAVPSPNERPVGIYTPPPGTPVVVDALVPPARPQE